MRQGKETPLPHCCFHQDAGVAQNNSGLANPRLWVKDGRKDCLSVAEVGGPFGCVYNGSELRIESKGWDKQT